MKVTKAIASSWTAIILAAGCVFVGCGETSPPDKARDTMEDRHKQLEQAIRISPEVMDSLRAKKKRFRITRDEYWDTKGGVLANEFLEVWYPPGPLTVTHGMHAFEQIVLARWACGVFFGNVPGETLKVVCTTDLEDFKTKTHREWWHYSEIQENRITFQPIAILYQRGLGEIAIAHEYHQWAVRRLSGNRAPRWLEEGLASYFSDEGDLLRSQFREFSDRKPEWTVDELEKHLTDESRRDLSRIAYYQAYKMVETLASKHGERMLGRVVLHMGEGMRVDEAFLDVFGKPYLDVLAEAMDYKIER